MKNDINLLYKRKTKTYSSKRVALIIFVIVLFAAGLYAGIALPTNALSVAKIEAAELESKLNSSTETQQDLTEKTQQELVLATQLLELNAIDASRSDISAYIEAIEKSLPTDANITQLLISDEMVSIMGIAKDDTVIATFCLRLREQNVFKDVYLISSTSPVDEQGTVFSLSATLPSSLSSIRLIQAIEQIGTAVSGPSAGSGASATPAPEVTNK
ncbi:MAG TPA: PilN domain-containing protein [Ignavibacteriales bacterium]|nr:PilN domain-containing protein [Ignavibacteriales bacterium]